MDMINLTAWEGRSESRSGAICQAQAAQIHATLGDPDKDAPQHGAPLPQLWHWCAFPPTVPNRALARDGHPALGDFLPPVQLERRMWASGRLTFGAPLKVGEDFTRRSIIAKVQEKEGSSGPMVFVSITRSTVRAASRCGKVRISSISPSLTPFAPRRNARFLKSP